MKLIIALSLLSVTAHASSLTSWMLPDGGYSTMECVSDDVAATPQTCEAVEAETACEADDADYDISDVIEAGNHCDGEC